jgi:hypothetical protein
MTSRQPEEDLETEGIPGEPFDTSHWSEVDLDRKTVLCNKRTLTDAELRELSGINRRLGYNVTK